MESLSRCRILLSMAWTESRSLQVRDKPGNDRSNEIIQVKHLENEKHYDRKRVSLEGGVTSSSLENDNLPLWECWFLLHSSNFVQQTYMELPTCATHCVSFGGVKGQARSWLSRAPWPRWMVGGGSQLSSYVVSVLHPSDIYWGLPLSVVTLL